MKRFFPQSQTHEKMESLHSEKATGKNLYVAQDVRTDLRVKEKTSFFELVENVAAIKPPDCDERADS